MEWIAVKQEGEIVYIEFWLTPATNIEASELRPAVEYIYNEMQRFRSVRISKIRITGRGPIWLYAAVSHTVAHMAPVIQVFDAIQKRWVTVISHEPSHAVGSVELHSVEQ